MTSRMRLKLVNNDKINVFYVFVLSPFWVSFWRCFGSPNGGQQHEKVVPKSHAKTGLKNDRFWDPSWVPKWSHKGFITGSCLK